MLSKQNNTSAAEGVTPRNRSGKIKQLSLFDLKTA